MTGAFQLSADVFQLKVILRKYKALGASHKNLAENNWNITMCF